MKRNFTISALIMLSLAGITRDANAQLKVGTDPTLIDEQANFHVKSSGGQNFTIDKASGKTLTTGDIQVKGSSLSVGPQTGPPSFSISPLGAVNASQVDISGGLNVGLSSAPTLSVSPGSGGGAGMVNIKNSNLAVGTSLSVSSASVNVTGANFTVGPSSGPPAITINSAGQITIPAGAGDNKILTSNTSGVASWQPLNVVQKFININTYTQSAGYSLEISGGFSTSTAPLPSELMPLNLKATFAPTKNTNDIIVDLLLNYNLSNELGGRVGFGIYLYLTNPLGVESPDPIAAFIHNTDTPGCFGESLTFKTSFKNLAAGTYTITAKVAKRRNANTGTNSNVFVGIGTPSKNPQNGASCGGSSPAGQKLLVSVYE